MSTTMGSPTAAHGRNGSEKAVENKSPHSSRRSHRSRSRSRDRDRDRHSSRSHKDARDRYRDDDRRRSDRDERRDSHRSKRSPDERSSRRSDDRDKDRERHHRDDRDRDRDRERDRNGGDHRRRKLDDVDGAYTRSDERSSKRSRGTEDPDVGRPRTNGPDRDLIDRVSKASVRDRSMESVPRSKQSEDGGITPSNRFPVDDRSPSLPRRSHSPTPQRNDDRPQQFGRRRSPPPPRRRRSSPTYHHTPATEDSEARSVFVSQLAARMTEKDLGYFFEEKLGEGTVIEPKIVTDRMFRRSKGIAYVELASIELVQKALELSGEIVMGLPIKVQLTESERNKQPSTSDPAGSNSNGGSMQLYVGSLHFNLTEADIKQVFEPFGELEFVDLHRDPATGRSKGYAFVQYKRAEDAKMALEQMEGFDLAGRQLRVNTVHEKTTGGKIIGGAGPVDSLEENGGSLNNNSSRHILMQKLARTEVPVSTPVSMMRPNIPEVKTRNVALKNMFDPAEETEPDWDTDLAEDVKGECTEKYGEVLAIKVIKESQGEIYVQFKSAEDASMALVGLNGRWFGGRLVSASYVSDVIMQAHL